jgi:hypothetical protein
LRRYAARNRNERQIFGMLETEYRLPQATRARNAFGAASTPALQKRKRKSREQETDEGLSVGA